MFNNNIKKIGFLSMIVFIISTLIGSGIFYINKGMYQLAHNDLIFVIVAWLIGLVGILFLGIALFEIASAQKTNAGAMEWTRMFTPHWFHYSISKFNKWLYNPILIFVMAIYSVRSFTDAGLKISNGYAVLGIALAIIIFFMTVNLLSFNVSFNLQWIIKPLHFIPLIAIPVIGIIGRNKYFEADFSNVLSVGLSGFNKWMVLIASFPLLAFALDGFYLSATLKQNLKQPAKSNQYMVIGLLIVALFYILFSISMWFVSSDGTMNGVKFLRKYPYLVTLFNVLIGIGAMSGVNVWILCAISQYRNQMDENEMPESYWIYHFLFELKIFGNIAKNWNRKSKRIFSNWLFLLFTILIHFILWGPIGSSLYTEDISSNSAHNLYAFAGVISSFSSIVYFGALATTLIGGLRNRSTKKIQVTKMLGFKFFAYTSIIMIFSSLIYIIVSLIMDTTGFNGADKKNALIKLITILSTIVFIFSTTFLEYKFKILTSKGYKKSFTKLEISEMATDDLAALEQQIDWVRTEFFRGRITEEEYNRLSDVIYREIYKKGK